MVVTSSGHRHVKAVDLAALADGTDFHHLRTYSVTKLLNVLFATELARRLQAPPAAAAATSVHLAVSERVASVSGGYFAECRPAAPSPLAQEQRLAEQAWQLSTRLLEPWLDR